MSGARNWIVAALLGAGITAGGFAVWNGWSGYRGAAESSAPPEPAGIALPDAHQHGPPTTGSGSIAAHEGAPDHGHGTGQHQPDSAPADHAGAAPAQSNGLQIDRELVASADRGIHGGRALPEAVITSAWQLLSSGSHDRAALLLRQNTEGADPASSSPVAEMFIWLGLAEELCGRWSLAEAAYARGLRGSPGQRAEGFALAGLARVWLARDKPQEALRLAADLFLQSATLARTSPWLQSEVEWLFADAAQRNYMAGRRRVAEEWAVVPFRPPPDVERMVSELWGRRDEVLDGLPAETAPPPVAAGPEMTAAPHPAETPVAEVLFEPWNSTSPAPPHDLDFDAEAQPVPALILELASRAGWRPTLSQEAKSHLAGRGKSVHVRQQPVECILDAILLPLGVSWEVREGELAVWRQGEQAGTGADAEAARRLLAAFANRHDRDPRRDVALLGIGNIALEEGDHDQAAASYELLWQRRVRGDLATSLMLNRALLQRALGRTENSLVELYRAADATWDSSLQSTAWINIAELCVELGKFDEAQSAAVRAARLQTSDEMARRAAIVQAIAYHWQSSPWAANQVVFDARQMLAGSRHQSLASFLACYGRYLGSQSQAARSAEQPRLLIALGNLPQQDALRPPVAGLVAAAWAQLGFEDLAAGVLMAALATGCEPYWHNRLALDLAVRQRALPRAEAAEILEFLANSAPPEAAAVAQLERAQLQFSEREFGSARDSARAAARLATDTLTRQQAIHLLGMVYNALDQPHAAALCFAGYMPGDPQPENSQRGASGHVPVSAGRNSR